MKMLENEKIEKTAVTEISTEVSGTKRKLACVKRIDDLLPIEGADKIEVAVVGGWKVVVKKGDFKKGELAVYLEIDSWVPTEVAPFLTKSGHEPKDYNGVKGERLRTVKLKKQISQGLLLPTTTQNSSGAVLGVLFGEGDDVSEFLGIQRWEPPIDARLAGNARGNFPYFIPKTDQARIQNLKLEFKEYNAKGITWEKTEKLHGSSMTVYLNQGEEGVCSRNIDLKQETGNAFWDIAIRDRMHEKMKSIAGKEGWNFAIQGELCGPGINGNTLKLKQHEFFVFDIYDIDKQEYLLPEERYKVLEGGSFKHVPVVAKDIRLNQASIEDVIQDADGRSTLADAAREGFVYKAMQDRNCSFKAISSEWLLKNE